MSKAVRTGPFPMGDWAMTSKILTLQVKEEQTRREETEAIQRVRETRSKLEWVALTPGLRFVF